jgi:hypothetical protein
MMEGVTLYWRKKDEYGKWKLTKVRSMDGVVEVALKQSRRGD